MASKVYPHPGMASTTTNQNVNVGPKPIKIICPSCHAEILTKIRYEVTTTTHLIALLLFCYVCWPCCVLPYCMDSCKNANHYCPKCDAFIGTYKS